jgi:hypothetical protein
MASIAARSGGPGVVGGERRTKVRRRTAIVAMTQRMMRIAQGRPLFFADDGWRISVGIDHLATPEKGT